MSKKGSILVMGIFFVFFLFILALYISQTVQKMSFDKTAGEDAIAIEKSEVASYRHRFFLEREGKNIVDDLEKEFNTYLDLKLTKSGSYYVLKDTVDLKGLAYDWLLQEFDSRLDKSINTYNRNVLEADYIYSEYLIDHKINYSFYEDKGLVYAYALAPTYVRSAGHYDSYYYWPHLRMESNFFTNINLPYDAKSIFERCYALRQDSGSCESDLKSRYPDNKVDVKEEKVSPLPVNAIEDSLVIDSRGDLMVKVNTGSQIVYHNSQDLGQTWSLDIDNDVFVADPTLYDKYLGTKEFKKYAIASSTVIELYFDNFLFILA